MGLPARSGPGLGGVGFSPDKPMLLIISSYEKRTPGYKAEGFMSMPLMNRNEESSLSLPGITSVPGGVPLQRSDGRVQWQNPCRRYQTFIIISARDSSH